MAQGGSVPIPFWTRGKILGSVLALILVIGVSGIAIIRYQNGRIAPSSNSGNVCTNGATNYPTCNDNSCQYGGTFPNCNPAPTCQYGGVYPNCSPANARCKGIAACFTDTVAYIVDGDTLDVGSIRIRLALVNKPR